MEKTYSPHAIEQRWYDTWEANDYFSAKPADESYFLVPTRRVGMQSQRAALNNRPQRGQYEFPRSAWERE